MKIKYTLILLLLTTTFQIWGQTLLPSDVQDYHDPSILKSAIAGNKNYQNGNAFTPKGDMRALIICVGFGPTWDNQSCGDWPTGPNTLPNWANSNEYMYNDYSDFSTYATSNHFQNISKFYYEMSNEKFRFIADVYPNRINIDLNGIGSFEAINRKALEVMKNQNPTFDWSPYDNRKNSPGYLVDNSTSSSDHVVDFLIFAYRYNNNWAGFPVRIASNGVASNCIFRSFNYNGYEFYADCGYTHFTGGENFYNLFIHELAHNIFDCPHYAMANGIVGDYFYGQHGWGMMKLSTVLNCALGWERWLLDWIEIKANGVNSEVNSASDLPSNGEFILRDHITTGDVIRIKLNNGNGNNQYLWIENHQGLSIFDERTFRTDECGYPMPAPPRGMLAYIESVKDDKIDFTNDIFSHAAAMNGLKFIHPSGNFDYDISSTATTGCLWGNLLYNFTESSANPISGQNRAEEIRWDVNNNNVIYFDNNSNSTIPHNEMDWIAKRNGVETKDYMGSGLAFPTNQKLGMDTNPALTSRPLYDSITSTMGYAYLNGVSVKKIADLSGNLIKVKIEFNDVDVNNNVRWTGNIALSNITNNSNADLILKEGKQVIFNRSGTANRTTKIDNKFVNYTNFRCESGSYFKMKPGSKVIVDENSTFTLQSGSTLEIEDGAIFSVMNNSKLVVETGASIIVKGRGGLIFKCNGQLCANNGANINLQDVSSSIHFVLLVVYHLFA